MARQYGSIESTAGSHDYMAGLMDEALGHPRGERIKQTITSDRNQERLAHFLGWFSIGLGTAEIVAPRQLGRMIGVGEHPVLMPLMGMREITSGVGILSQRKPAGWLWSRVAGDMLDLALLGVAMASPGTQRWRTAMAIGAVAKVTVLDIFCAQQMSRKTGLTIDSLRRQNEGPIEVIRSLAVNKPPDEVYSFWRNIANLPRFMSHLESVEVTGEGRSRWVAKAPAGTHVEWEAKITDDRPNERISWRSLEGATVENRGTVRFERGPGGQGTIVRLELEYNPPAGRIGAAIAKLFGEEPGEQVADDLRRFKRVIETGEIPTTHGQPSGRSTMSFMRD
jgi:uncharacterized membrane protein